MSIDRFYTQLQGKWVRINERIVDGHLEFMPIDGRSDFDPDFWVDVCHVVGTDERYYFPDLASALDFYLDGWKERQLLEEDGTTEGIDHSGLYSRGRLIHGLSIQGDPPGHDGENLCSILGAFVEKRNENKKP